MTIKHGDKVRCLAGSIDRKSGAGEVGYVTGFARLSSYHGREVFVTSKSCEGAPTAPWNGWFWESDVQPIS